MLHLKHRPRDWTGYVASSPDVAALRADIDAGRFDGGPIWIVGPSGCGKTTLAEIVVATLGIEGCAITEIDGADCTVDAVREVSNGLQMRPMFGEWRAIVVNESHCMTDKAVQKWLTALERLPEKVVVIFTTTEDCRGRFGEFGEPMLSRCLVIRLQRPEESGAVVRLRAICESEGIEATDWQLGELFRREGRNLRAAIGKLRNLPEPKPAPIEAKPAETPVAAPKPRIRLSTPPTRPAAEIERERLAIDAERQRRIAERVAQATAEPEPIKPIKPVAATPPMSAGALVELLLAHGTKCTVQQAEILLATCNGSIEALESLVKMPLRQAHRIQEEKTIRGGFDHRKKAKAESRRPAPEPDDSRPTSDPSTWRIVAPLCVLLWFAWPWISLSADFAVWTFRTAISVWIYLDR